MKEKKHINPIIVGLYGAGGMVLFYAGLLALTSGDPLHPWFFFLDRWYFLVPMIVGFGVQMWLFQRMRIQMMKNQGKMALASAGMSGTAMVSCCAHHLADVLPLVGFASIATSVSQYQDVFLATGVLITMIGVWYMYRRLIQLQDMQCAIADAF